MKPKISVIIPIYNVEKYIERCIHSLFKQTMSKDIEYIFVNDCTPDNSIKKLNDILLEYPQIKENIHIINHSHNMGSATARNSGLKQANGEYIIHCDSDDWVNIDMYEKLYKLAKRTDSDICCCDFFEEFAHKQIYRRQNFPNIGKECIKKSFQGELHCGMWNKLVKKNLYVKYNICFPDSVNFWEDVTTINRLYYYANNISYLPEALYHYTRYNETSYTNHLNHSSCLNILSAVDILQKFLDAQNADRDIKKAFLYLQLTAKLNLLLNSKKEQQVKWNALYPNARKVLFSYKRMSPYWRIALMFAYQNRLETFNIFAKSKSLIAKISK